MRRCSLLSRSPLTSPMMIVLAAALLLVGGCGQPKVSDRDLAFINVDETAALMDGRSGVLGVGSKKARVIDPRSTAKFREGRIPGAINLSLEDIRADHPQLRGYDVLIVYGDDYREPIALAMAKRLMALGYKDVRTLQGGLRSWQRDGRPVETGSG